MNILNCVDLSQQLAKLILQSRYKHRIDFILECNQIRKKWNPNGENQLTIQFYLKKQLKSYLIEEWNIICNHQQIPLPQQLFDKCIELAAQTPISKELEIDHIIRVNENKKTDWIDPNLIVNQQFQLDHMTISVAYLQNYNIIEQSAVEVTTFRRDRFLSDDIETKKGDFMRQNSYNDLDGLRQYKKNKAVITSAKNRMNDSFSSNSSFQLLTIINKKDDVEILSSAEDAQKIIDQDENGDYNQLINVKQ